jgi:hypothetical protein
MAEAAERPGARRAIAFAGVMIVLFSIIHRYREDSDTQRFLAGPVGLPIAVAVAIATVATLVWWNWSEERRPFLWAVLITSALNSAGLVHATRAGWVSGIAFAPALSIQLLIVGPGFVGFLAVPLGIYRWLGRRSNAKALIIYLAIVAAISIVSFPVEEDWVRRGVYVMDRG